MPASPESGCDMRLVSVRWVGLLLFAIGFATTTGAARGSDGRWKLGDDGSCYFDQTDSGPDQCSPSPGRWKLGGDGSCYFDAADSGPDQCTPAEPAPAEVTVDEVVVLNGFDESVTPSPAAADRGVIRSVIELPRLSSRLSGT
jgi:hypothetical protein